MRAGPGGPAGAGRGGRDVRDARDRDRDSAGRPKDARPRDGLGRPLARGAFGEPTMPDDLGMEPGDAVQLAQRLIDEGRPFHAHEVFEAVWKSGPADQRELWQGLAQVAVGLTHAMRGNSRGAVSLLRRGSAAVEGYRARDGYCADGPAGAMPAGIDAAGIVGAATRLADQIDAGGLASLTDADLRPRLTRPTRAG